MAVLPILMILVSAAIIPGIISITKAKLSGRKGITLFQPLKDILRLFRKGNVYSTTTSLIFQITPVIHFAGIACALLFLPFSREAGLLSFSGDFLFFAYLLAFTKFMLIINAMDTGSGFEGMGANREALYSMLAEPAFFTIMASLVLLTGFTSFQEVYTNVHFGDSSLSYLFAAVSIYLLVQIAMVENSRLPVDDPRTHLELTMIHEVMVLDNSGFDLGLIVTGNAFKFAMYGNLIANFLLPQSFPLVVNIAIYLIVQVLFAVTVGLLESFRARNKIANNPQFIITLSSIALVLFFSVLIITHKLILD